MFKRFLVMDLFEPTVKQDGEWIEAEKELPDTTAGIYMVKSSNSTICPAYFCLDRIHHLARPRGIEPSYWWDKQTREPIYNITHWLK